MRRDRKHHGQDYEREYPYRGDWGEGSVPAEGRLGWWDLPVSRTEYGGQDWRGDEFTHNVPVRN